MIDEQRVRVMTRLALREKKMGYGVVEAGDLSRKDFVSFYGVRAFFSGTIFYILAFIIFLAVLFSIITVQVNVMNVAITAFGGLLGYLFFLLFYLRYERHRNIRRYDEYQQIIREQQKDIDELTSIYEAEDKNSHKDTQE